MSEDSERIANLEQRLAEITSALAQFTPLTVDLRIDGKVRPVVILAIDQPAAQQPAFSIVQ